MFCLHNNISGKTRLYYTQKRQMAGETKFVYLLINTISVLRIVNKAVEGKRDALSQVLTMDEAALQRKGTSPYSVTLLMPSVDEQTRDRSLPLWSKT